MKNLALLALFAHSTLFSADKDEPTTLVFPSFLHTMGIRKATKTHLRIYTRNRVRVRDPQGVCAVLLESWDNPNDRSDDDMVTGYGIDAGENIIVYNTSMKSLSIYGLNEGKVKSLNRPSGVAASTKGDVYVADTGNHRIVRLFNPKKSLQFVRALGSKGPRPGQFNSPTGIALDIHGRLYVADTGNHRVQILLANDTVYLWFGKQGVAEGELWHPTGIAVTNSEDRWSFYRDSFIALIDLDHSRIQKFTLDGKFIKSVKLADFGFAKGHLAYLAMDYYSNIWVTDMENHCVHKLDRDLNYLTSFGQKGSGDREFLEPRGITIYKRFGQVFIAEKESAQYYWIGTDISGLVAEFDAKTGKVNVDFFLTEPSFLTLEVKNTRSGEKFVAFEKVQFFSGAQVVTLDGNWRRSHTRTSASGTAANGLPDQPKSVKQGEYELSLKVEPTYSSYRYFSKEVRTTLLVN